MSLKIYRIDNSLVGKGFRILRKPDLPVMAASGTLFGQNFIRGIRDCLTGDNYYLIGNDELDRFINPLGNSWIQKEQYYVRHPKAIKDRELIEAQNFQEYILREQISDIVSFLRANIQIKNLYIKSLNHLNFNLGVNVPIEDMQVEGNVEIKTYNEYELKITSKTRLKISEKRKNYTWIDDFSTLKVALDNFEGGLFEEKIIIDNSFGMNLKEASIIGMNTKLMEKKEFIIKFEAE